MARDQFDHIVAVLKKKGLQPTTENIAAYMLSKSKQRSKFIKRIAIVEEEKVAKALEKLHIYVKTIRFKIRLFNYYLVVYKKGSEKTFEFVKVWKDKNKEPN